MDSFAKFFVTFLSAWLIVSFGANLLIIVCIRRQMKSTGMISAADVFVLNLAICDLIFGGFVLPQQLHDISHSDDYYEAPVLCKMVNAMPIVCITTSIYTMVAMSLERYRRVVLRSLRVLHWRQASIVTAVVWLFAVAVAMPTAVAYDVNADSSNGTKAVCESNMAVPFNLVYSQVILLACYILPQGALYANYGRLVEFLWRRSRLHGRVAPIIPLSAATNAVAPVFVVANGNAAEGGSFVLEAMARKNWNVVKMLLLLTLLFLISWLPYFTLQTLSSVTGKTSSRFDDSYLNMAKLLLETCSISFNFPLYLRYNFSFRKAFRNLFHLRRHFSNSVEPASGNLSQIHVRKPE